MRNTAIPLRVLLGVFVIALLILGLPPTSQASASETANTGPDASTSENASGDGADYSAAGTAEGSAASAGNAPIFIGVSGFSFEDLDPRTTPNLWKMMKSAQIGTITPRSVRATSCPVDGWLAVGSGRRAADEPREECRQPAPPLDGWVADWDVYSQVARGDNYDAGLGGLSE